jgi:glycosyltransferase involved in cell wall biosynthesis
MTTPTLFSALIPCRNAAPVLRQCLDSCKAAGFDEILVYLDACEDDSKGVCQGFAQANADYPFIILEGEGRIGVQMARNTLFRYASPDAKYICYMDADDFRVGDRSDLESLKASLEAAPNPDLTAGIISPAVFYFRDPHHASDVYDEKIPRWATQDRPLPSIWELLAWRGIQTGGILWNRQILDAFEILAGDIWVPERTGLQDVNLVLDLLLCGYQFLLHPKCLHYYRWNWSPNQVTIADRAPYQQAVINFLNRLHTHAPSEFSGRIARSLAIVSRSIEEVRQAIDAGFSIDDEGPYFS